MKARLLLAPLVLLTASCMLGPDFQAPEADGGAGWKRAAADGGTLPGDWWRLFNDSSLNQVVERALSANNDLVAAQARVNTARALVGIDQARLFPTVDASGSAGITEREGGSRQAYRASFDLAFDPDLFGRNKRLLESSTARADAAAAAYDAQRLGLAAEVARAYFVLRGLDEQEVVLNETLKSRQEALDIQKTKTDAGLTDGLATSSARTELELARKDLADVQRQRGSAEHALAVLCGTRPSDFDIGPAPNTPGLPTIRPNLPATVLARRPDVRATVENLRSVNARIGVAEANFYPSFNIVGSAGLQSVKASDFLNWESRALSIGANAFAPLLNQGANIANLEAARSQYEEALALYRQTLLVALREVEDSIIDIQGLADSRAALDAALASSKDTRQLTQERYNEGLTSYLDVVTADRTVLQIRLAIAVVEAQQRISLALLAKALGGGWSGK